MLANKKDEILIAPITDGPGSEWEGHHTTNPTAIRLSGDPRIFLGYRAGGDDDLYYLGDKEVWSSHLGLAALDDLGQRVLHRFPLPIFTLDKMRHLPKSPEEFEEYIKGPHRDKISSLHDFRFWEDQGWLYVIYHEATIEKAFDCVKRITAADFLKKVDKSIQLIEHERVDLKPMWREIWWRDDVWESCGVDGTNRICPSQMSKNDIIYLRLTSGELLMYHRPVPDIAVVRTGGNAYLTKTNDGITMIGHLQSCIRPGYRDNSHIGNNGMPITARIGDTPVAMDVPHGVYNEALSDESITQKWKLLYYPYLRLLDLATGECLYYSRDPILTYDEIWDEYAKRGKWVSVIDHLDGVMFAGGTVELEAGKNGIDDLFRNYIGVGDTAVAVADFRLRDMLPEAVANDIRDRRVHRDSSVEDVQENRAILSGETCGWR